MGGWIHREKVDAAHTNIGSSTHYPVLGACDCHDPAIAERHRRDVKTAGELLRETRASAWKNDGDSVDIAGTFAPKFLARPVR